MVGINRSGLSSKNGRSSISAKVSLVAVALFLWWGCFQLVDILGGGGGGGGSEAEVQLLRSNNNINKNNNIQKPAQVEFIPDDNKFASNDNNNNNDATTSSSIPCTYKRLSDLTETEIQPIAGKHDDMRHMKTPPIGGKVSLVCCDTTVGPLSIVAHSAWSPHGSKRFLEMVESGYMNSGIPLFRCMKGFLCQFGLSSDPQLSKKFNDVIPDDPNWLPEGPTHRKNEKGVLRFANGYLAYAGGGPNTRNKQLIMALKANGPLAGGSPWEVPWGELVGPDSFETLSKIYTGYGDHGPGQGRLMREGVTEALREEFPKMDYINSCQLLDERVQEEPFHEVGI